jgi:hypothetical protein
MQPFKHIPKRVKIEFVYFIVLWLNTFPVRMGILSKYSPQELLVRWRLDYKKHWQVLPGTYCEAHDEPVPSNSMEPWIHELIALRPTRNLQWSIKFYCLNNGQVLKHRSFTLMIMPHCIIKWVNAIGQREGQGREFRFLNRWREPFTWTNKVPEDDSEFQELLENKDEEAVYPDILAELPGVTLEDKEDSTPVVIEEEEPDFQDLAAQALENARIDTEECIWAANNLPPAALLQDGPALVEDNNDKIVYELTFNLLDAGLGVIESNIPPAELTLGDDQDNTVVTPLAAVDNKPEQRYPTWLRRSIIGHQPYDTYAPRTTFLQLGTTQVHRSVIEATRLIKMTKAEQLLVTTTSDTMCNMIDDAVHEFNPQLASVGIPYDTIQFKTGIAKVRTKGSRCSR